MTENGAAVDLHGIDRSQARFQFLAVGARILLGPIGRAHALTFEQALAHRVARDQYVAIGGAPQTRTRQNANHFEGESNGQVFDHFPNRDQLAILANLAAQPGGSRHP